MMLGGAAVCASMVLPTATRDVAAFHCPTPATSPIYLFTLQVSHGDFVTGWAALPRVGGAVAVGEEDLPPHAADLVKVVSGRVAVRYTPQSS